MAVRCPELDQAVLDALSDWPREVALLVADAAYEASTHLESVYKRRRVLDQEIAQAEGDLVEWPCEATARVESLHQQRWVLFIEALTVEYGAQESCRFLQLVKSARKRSRGAR